MSTNYDYESPQLSRLFNVLLNIKYCTDENGLFNVQLLPNIFGTDRLGGRIPDAPSEH